MAWEAQAASHTAHRRGDKVVQVPIGWCRQFQGTEADILEGFLACRRFGVVGFRCQIGESDGQENGR